MLDLKALRDDPETFREGLARRDAAGAVGELLDADSRRRELTAQIEALRAEQNAASKRIGGGEGAQKQQLLQEVARVSAEPKTRDPELSPVQAARTAPAPRTATRPEPSA